MASDDLKNFLQQSTGVPETRWKRVSKKVGANGAAVRLFEDRATGRRVLTQELDGALSILEDSQANGFSPTVGPAEHRFAIVLCEAPSFDDALDDLLDGDPSFDLSYRWLTTLRLLDDDRTSDPQSLNDLRAALPGYRLTAPGPTEAGFVFDDLIFVIKQDLATGWCTCESDRVDMVRRLEARGWTFAPEIAEAYAFRNGVPDELVGPIVPWRPGMPLPTPQSESAEWLAQVEELEALLNHDEFVVTPRPVTAARGASVPQAAARFSFAFGENPELPPGHWQKEWLVVVEQGETSHHDRLQGALTTAGMGWPCGLTEMEKGVFNYGLGEPRWTRERLLPRLLATGMTWDHENCVLATQWLAQERAKNPRPWWKAKP